MKKKRLDVLLHERGLCESRSLAQRIIMAGVVSVDGQIAAKSSQLFDEQSHITIKERPKYVSRGGYKLEKALEEFGLGNLDGRVCVDVGASTGGFTDCLLQHGARSVYAVDVGYGQLHYSLRSDPRIVVMERTNVREIHHFPQPISLVTIDASFISLKTILPVIRNWPIEKEMEIIALVKPQFEVGREIAARGKGVITRAEDRQAVIDGLTVFIAQEGFDFRNLVESPLKGPKGNTEFLMHIVCR
jgi:23S rRNA (cytidine1920-2'-O)/16S rRNA (cytidine1409-2'-O)-methyltransferase